MSDITFPFMTSKEVNKLTLGAIKKIGIIERKNPATSSICSNLIRLHNNSKKSNSNPIILEGIDIGNKIYSNSATNAMKQIIPN